MLRQNEIVFPSQPLCRGKETNSVATDADESPEPSRSGHDDIGGFIHMSHEEP